jgi:SAM-dependent methyltransferase
MIGFGCPEPLNASGSIESTILSCQLKNESMISDGSPWYHDAFSEDYLDVYLHRDQAEAETAARFLADVLELNPETHRLLDLCCGGGRHLLPLSRHVRYAAGLDLSQKLLEYTARLSRPSMTREHPNHGSLMLVRGNMVELPFKDNSFDRIVNLFTSFGYFHEEEKNRQVVAEMARVMKPGGRLGFDHINKETMLNSLKPKTNRELQDGRRIVEIRAWDPESRRIDKRIELTGENIETKTWTESVRVYSVEEIEDMMMSVQLQPIGRYGDYQGSSWAKTSQRFIMITEKS